MEHADLRKLFEQYPVLGALSDRREAVWENPGTRPFEEVRGTLPLKRADVDDAEARLLRFAPFIEACFPETAESRGIIESPLREIPEMRLFLNENFGAGIAGRLYLKMDSHLPISGSVKARGGIYEVLKHTPHHLSRVEEGHQNHHEAIPMTSRWRHRHLAEQK